MERYIVFAVIYWLLFIGSVLMLFTGYRILGAEEKETYTPTLYAHFDALEPFLKEKSKRTASWTYPEFYNIVKKNKTFDYEYVLIHYRYHPCYPIMTPEITYGEQIISIRLRKESKLTKCPPDYTSDFDVIRIHNPEKKPYTVYIDTSYGFGRFIQSFEAVLKEQRTK